MVNQRVTALSFNVGTSEAACDITFMFNNYLNQKVSHKKINKKFLEWFIGFTEGKGSFIVLNNKVYFDINVSIKDIQVIYYIKKELGFGKVMIKNSDSNNSIGRTVSFYLTSEENFSRLVSIFNGNLCTVNKKQEFKNWLIIFNNQYSKYLFFIDRVIKPSLTSGWLSGYIDAQGSFIGLTENKELNAPYKTLYLIFSIYLPNPTGGDKARSAYDPVELGLLNDQKEFFILKDISVVLRTSFKNIKYNKDINGWKLTISSFKQIKLIVNYLKRYPLKTKKSLAFDKWCKIYNITLNKEHLYLTGLNKISSLSSRLEEINKHKS